MHSDFGQYQISLKNNCQGDNCPPKELLPSSVGCELQYFPSAISKLNNKNTELQENFLTENPFSNEKPKDESYQTNGKQLSKQ